MNVTNTLFRISPLAESLANYDRAKLTSDLIAGLIVAIMLVPQAMAYAMLAGLPPQVGLYASIAPLVLYSVMGTSNYLAVGPVAMVSLLVLSGVSELATPGSDAFIGLCLTLALLVGILQVLMAILRLGFLVNFISHPVLVGFTSAAAIVIGFSQMKHLLGTSVDNGEYPFQLIQNAFASIGGTNLWTLAIGLASLLLLLGFNFRIAAILKRIGISENVATTLSRLGPLFAVIVMSLFVFGTRVDQSHSVSIVGAIPGGLPGFTVPDLSWQAIRSLLPLAIVITLVGYMESISVAKSLAGRNRERIDANRELFALGVADIGAAFTGGYPITGGFSRSMVNYAAGVRTPLGSVFTALYLAVSVWLLTPAFFYIPQSVLAAIIVVAVAPLVDLTTPFKLWKYSRTDAISLLVTFVAVLGLGIELGILAGVVTTILTMVWKMSRPHVAEVGRVGKSDSFRNIVRHDVHVTDGVLAFRVDASLNFANAPFLESYVVDQIAAREEISDVLLVANGINSIDSTGLEVLESIHHELLEAQIGFFLSEVKGPVADRLALAGFDKVFLRDHIFMTTDQAIRKLQSRRNSPIPVE